MIDIKINGKSLVLYHNTTLLIELNNSLFASDVITGDVTYTFEIPVKGNEDAFSFSHDVHALRGKRYDCSILFSGVQFVSGVLVIQKVARYSVEVGVICNNLPKGWADKSVREDINEIVEIASANGSLYQHKYAWKRFLSGSLDPASGIKFGLIRNDENYGADNEDFGYWNGGSMIPLVNRLFLYNGEPVENIDKPLMHLFNDAHFFNEELEMNQMAFCPQFRLVEVLRKVFLSAGYRVVGDFFKDEDISKVFLQSPVALDGDTYQYVNSLSASAIWTPDEDDPRFTSIVYVRFSSGFNQIHWLYSVPSGANWSGNRLEEPFSYILEDGTHYCPAPAFVPFSGSNIVDSIGRFVPPVEGVYRVSFSIRIPLFYFKSSSVVARMPGAVLLCKGHYPLTLTDGCVVCSKEYDNLLDRDSALSGEFVLPVTSAEITAGDRYGLMVVYIAEGNVVFAVPPGPSILDIALFEHSTVPGLNIFAKSFSLGQCLPDMTNSAFLNAIRKAFGVAFFTDKSTNTVELSTASQIVNTESLNLTDYVLNNETSVTVTPTACTFSYGIMESSPDPDQSTLLPPVQSVSELPDAFANVDKYCFVRDSNGYWHSEKEEDESTCWRYVWRKAYGNDNFLQAGDPDGDAKDLSTAAIVPMQCEYALKSADGSKSLIPDIPFRIESPMFGKEKGSDLIFLYYRGRERYLYRKTGRIYEFESMLPVSESGFSIRTEGSSSSGELFIRPWLDVVSSSDIFKYQFRLPLLKALEVLGLFRPAIGVHAARWIIVDNVRTMPRKVTLEISNSCDTILCEIESVRPSPV